jgi:membrane protease subunit (stomatin/prohibitin family)
MGLWDKIAGEFIDIIEWLEENESEVLAHRFQRYQNEIKNGAQLTVREGQAAVFVNEGKLADVFQPGRYRLETANLPILATLKGWKYGFNSPFKAEVYFISTRQRTGLKWGTANPIMLRDPEFGPVRVRAFGTYAMKVSDPRTFLQELVATDPSFETYEIAAQLRSMVLQNFTDALGKAKIAVLDLAGHYSQMGTVLLKPMNDGLGKMGLSLTQFYIENISLPPEVEAALDKRTQMGVLGDLNKYTQFQTAEAIRDAAQNPGGVAGVGAGMGAGFAIGQQMATAAAQSFQAPAAALAPSTQPPPLPTAVQFFAAINGAQAGPFDLNALAEKVRAGQVSRQTLVWKHGMASWSAADSVADLQSLFAMMPPPLPQ